MSESSPVSSLHTAKTAIAKNTTASAAATPKIGTSRRLRSRSRRPGGILRLRIFCLLLAIQARSLLGFASDSAASKACAIISSLPVSATGLAISSAAWRNCSARASKSGSASTIARSWAVASPSRYAETSSSRSCGVRSFMVLVGSLVGSCFAGCFFGGGGLSLGFASILCPVI